VAEAGSLTGALVGAGVTHTAEVLDMPVDPNEPTYCLCNQVSYGEMIGCDNPDVSIFIVLDKFNLTNKNSLSHLIFCYLTCILI